MRHVRMAISNLCAMSVVTRGGFSKMSTDVFVHSTVIAIYLL